MDFKEGQPILLIYSIFFTLRGRTLRCVQQASGREGRPPPGPDDPTELAGDNPVVAEFRSSLADSHTGRLLLQASWPREAEARTTRDWRSTAS
jgi:hypothetical protein